MIATDVDGAMIHFGTEKARLLNRLTVAEATAHMAAGHFPEGSMGPKMTAAVEFIRAGGRRAVITSVEKIEPAVDDLSVGTQFAG